MTQRSPSDTEWDILALLFKNGDMRASRIGYALWGRGGSKKNSWTLPASNILTRMHDEGWVENSRIEKYYREWRLTTAGTELARPIVGC